MAAASIVILAAFARWELRREEPMLDLRYFRHRGFSIGSLGMALVFFAMFGFMFLLTQYMQLVLGYSALGTALRMLPFVFVMITIAPQTPRLAAARGAHRVVSAGLLTVAAGMALLSRIGVATDYWVIVVVMMLLACGMALSMAPMTNSIMSGVPRAKAGIGSAMNDTSRELGGALGVAVLGSIANSRYTSTLKPSLAGLPPEVVSAAHDSLAGALGAASRMGDAGAGLAAAARQAFVDGMTGAVLAGAAVIAVAAIVARRHLPAEDPAGEQPAAPPLRSS
ncbi:MAG: MFS transporter [Acidimicrobiia bacterium]|nr:MFS transporter [Acidimicrobiia bacterium]